MEVITSIKEFRIVDENELFFCPFLDRALLVVLFRVTSGYGNQNPSLIYWDSLYYDCSRVGMSFQRVCRKNSWWYFQKLKTEFLCHVCLHISYGWVHSICRSFMSNTFSSVLLWKVFSYLLWEWSWFGSIRILAQFS